jgi:hypothetical protein
MRRIIIYSFVIALVATSCATIPISENIPDKYNLDSQLERLTRTFYIMPSSRLVVDIIDRQSFIMTDRFGDYHYLIILKNPSNFLLMNPSVSIEVNEDMEEAPWCRPGDRVVSYYHGCCEIHFISRIYNLKTREEAKGIKAKLRGEKK